MPRPPPLTSLVEGARAAKVVARTSVRARVCAGAFIIRRLVGIAHTADMDTIEDAAVRAGCERRALLFGRLLLVAPQQYASVRALVAAAVAAAHP